MNGRPDISVRITVGSSGSVWQLLQGIPCHKLHKNHVIDIQYLHLLEKYLINATYIMNLSSSYRVSPMNYLGVLVGIFFKLTSIFS